MGKGVIGELFVLSADSPALGSIYKAVQALPLLAGESIEVEVIEINDVVVHEVMDNLFLLVVRKELHERLRVHVSTPRTEVIQGVHLSLVGSFERLKVS